jgi:hypothetical protein
MQLGYMDLRLKTTLNCMRLVQQSSRSERQHKAWGASPRNTIGKSMEAEKRRQRMILLGCRPLCGLTEISER